MNHIDEYLAGPALVRKAVAGMSRAQATARPVPGKWSTLEVVCHLADFDPIYVDRMKRVIADENPTLLGADEQKFAAHLSYQDRDLEEELRVLEATRTAFARVLRTLKPEAFLRTGLHSERGPVTLEKLLTSITGHITHHLKFIEDKRRALGLPAS